MRLQIVDHVDPGVSVSLWPLFLFVLGVLCAGTACRRTPAPLPPLVAQVSGTLTVSGLSTPVRVVRDTWGVPHIYAANQDDLFTAQGFVQAQDRLFQMDLWRRSAQGRLSEVLGPNFIERDAMTRRLQYRGDADLDWASYGPDAKAIAAAFVRGVNAWVALARERPPEAFVLAGWTPEPWSIDDLLSRTDAFTSGGDALDEVFRTRLIAAVGLAHARLLLPGDRAIALAPGLDPALIPAVVADAVRRVGTPPFFVGLAAAVTEGTVRITPDAAADHVHTLDHPSRRYFVHLNAPGWNVIGATAPWRPGVAAGHNDRVAWNAEPIDADTQDIYVERLNPDNPRQVENGRRWIDIAAHKEFVAVRGRKAPLDFQRETTPHGVIVASDLEHHLAFAIRWTGSEPGTAPEVAAPALDRARSATAFAGALARWKMPVRRMVFSDADGGRGSQVAGLVPVRRGWSGALPVPGWSGTAEWSGWTKPPLAARAPVSGPTPVASMILESARLHPDRADALLGTLAALSSSPDSLTKQRAAIVDLLADALRDRHAPAGTPVLFAHPLGVTPAARRRFNISVPAPAAAGTDPLAIRFDAGDWDRSTAIAAPGQSESADSRNFADLAKLWSAGQFFPLAFTDTAVQAHTATTLTLTPR
ncbi:MAG: Penicillin amidase [Acidobacteria bacterium]|nr:Penicillin amidase [Acidobacteriota bacterium]